METGESLAILQYLTGQIGSSVQDRRVIVWTLECQQTRRYCTDKALLVIDHTGLISKSSISSTAVFRFYLLNKALSNQCLSLGY